MNKQMTLEKPTETARSMAQLHDAPLVRADASSLIEVISRAASDPNTDVEKLERLLAMYERVKSREAKSVYTEALTAAQMEIPAIPERGTIIIGTNNKQKYALWEDINDTIKPILARHGFALSFRTGAEDGKIKVTGILSHKDGHSEETSIYLPTDTSGSKNAVQAVGSSTSYGKRYTTQALLNLTSRGEDDDGKAGGKLGASITPTQADKIVALLTEKNADIKAFCKYMKIEHVDDMPAADYDRAIAAIQAKK